MAGGLVTRAGRRARRDDSARRQRAQRDFPGACKPGRHEEVRRIVLTASGGPFRELSLDQLKQVTVDDALAHPTWDMGPKITVDSATMMNKALEIIESRWLFDLTAEQIEVVIHPQSIVHSFVEFVDGSVIAQLGPPDMKLPIQYALEYPHRQAGHCRAIGLATAVAAGIRAGRRRALPGPGAWATNVRKAGGTSGAVLNAANEAAVEAFLEGELHFTEIVPACRSVLEVTSFRIRSHARAT